MKQFFISGRQTGKTAMATAEFLKHPAQSIFICNNRNDLNIKKVKTYNNIIDTMFGLEGLKISDYDTLIIDECLYYPLKTQATIRNFVKNHENLRNIYVYSTPQKHYNETRFNYIHDMKRDKKPYTPDAMRVYTEIYVEAYTDYEYATIPEAVLSEISAELNELYHNLITEPDFAIIKNDTPAPGMQKLYDDGILQSDVEVTGKYLK